jgi:hypothetical protein
VFRAPIAAGLNDSDGVSVDANPFTLSNGAAIRDAAGNDALTSFAGLAPNTAYKVDTIAPTLSVDAVTGDDVVNLSDKTAGVNLSGASDAGPRPCSSMPGPSVRVTFHAASHSPS